MESTYSRDEMAAMIDQTLLKPTAGYEAAATWIEECRDAGFATLCVSPFLVPLVAQRLAGTCTKTCSVAGFPLGFSCTETKAEEASRLVGLGAVEVDMVANIAAIVEGADELVRDDIAAVVASVVEASEGTGLVKVILETGYLEPDQVKRASLIAVEAGASYVKTSTGFGPRGASAEDVRAIRETVGESAGVKASGGIRDLTVALEMLEAGATRLGTSSGLEILRELEGEGAEA